MEILMSILPVILYILLSILVVVLIILIFKAMNTLDKVDKTLEDVNYKMGKLNGLFNLVDRGTDAINMFTDRIVSTITTGVVNLFNKKKKEKSENE